MAKVKLPANIGWVNERNDNLLAADVMAFETFQNGMTEILEYLINKHRGVLRHSEPIRSECEEYIIQIREGYLDDLTEQEGVDFFERVLDAIYNETGHNIKYGIWLSKEVEQKYIRYDHYPKAVFHHKGPVVLLMCEDGGLYGYEKLPEPIYYESFRKTRNTKSDTLTKTENLDNLIGDAFHRSDSSVLKYLSYKNSINRENIK